MKRFLAVILSFSSLAMAQPTPLLERYVALGDSITAGYQSAGMTAATQNDAYPVLLSRKAGYPLTAYLTGDPGCPPPRGGTPGPQSCVRANPDASPRNFAVPGARVGDLTQTRASNAPETTRPLVNLLIGEQTQVEAALAAQPTFLTIWIGSNDVLLSAIRGTLEGTTSAQDFETRYRTLLEALKPTGAPGVLIGVPRISHVPALLDPNWLVLVGQASSDCWGGIYRIPAPLLANKDVPKPISCRDPRVLTLDELNELDARVEAYNRSIARLAAQYGYVFYDVAPLFDAMVRPPNLLTGSFGPDFSADGAHPSSASHVRFAQELARLINARYGTRLPE